MSRLHVRKRSGKVVLERPEGVASCRRFRLTSFAGAYTHYVTRNRTQGLDSFPFSPRLTGPEHRSPLWISQRERSVPGRGKGTIAHEAPFTGSLLV